MNNKMATKEGFTLIETMIVIVVLTIGILGVATMQYSSVISNTRASNLTTATTIATDQVEFLLGLDSTDALLADNDNARFQRTGLPVTEATFLHPGATPANASQVLRQINDIADNSVAYTDQGYTVFYDGEPVMDPGAPATQVAIDFRLYVVWLDGARQRTLEVFFTKLI